jgi:hypothetical protein
MGVASGRVDPSPPSAPPGSTRRLAAGIKPRDDPAPKSVPGIRQVGKADWIVWCQATDLFFSAMAAHQLGKTEDAHRWLAEAHRLIATVPRADNTNWLMMDLARRETEALVAGKNADSRK